MGSMDQVKQLFPLLQMASNESCHWRHRRVDFLFADLHLDMECMPSNSDSRSMAFQSLRLLGEMPDHHRKN